MRARSDLGLLTALDALLEEGTVTGAAKRLGLSTPATSQALGRLRTRLGDPLLVRAGQKMIRTPHAEALRPRVRALVLEALTVLEPERRFIAKDLTRSFVVRASDYVTIVLGEALDAYLAEHAPNVGLKFVGNGANDGASLRSGTSDLAIGIYGDLPPEVRTQRLLTDRHVLLARADHPALARVVDIEAFLAHRHVLVAPRGGSTGYVDEVLRELGRERRIVRTFRTFYAALDHVRRSDTLLVLPERIVRARKDVSLRAVEPPLALLPYALRLVWHPNRDEDPGLGLVRAAFVHAAKLAAPDLHPNARTAPGIGKRR